METADVAGDGNITMNTVTAMTPSFEIGSTTQLKLSFAKKKTDNAVNKVSNESSKQVWTLSAMDMNDDDMVGI